MHRSFICNFQFNKILYFHVVAIVFINNVQHRKIEKSGLFIMKRCHVFGKFPLNLKKYITIALLIVVAGITTGAGGCGGGGGTAANGGGGGGGGGGRGG